MAVKLKDLIRAKKENEKKKSGLLTSGGNKKTGSGLLSQGGNNQEKKTGSGLLTSGGNSQTGSSILTHIWDKRNEMTGSGLLTSDGNRETNSNILTHIWDQRTEMPEPRLPASSGNAQNPFQAAIDLLNGIGATGQATQNIAPYNPKTVQPAGRTQPQGLLQPGGMPNYAEMLANRNLGGGQAQGVKLPGTDNIQGIVPAAQTGGSADYVRKVLGMSSNINRPQQPESRMQTVQAQGITAPGMRTISNNYAGSTAQKDNIGQYGAGNIDLNHRQVVHNPDGSISTERSFSVNIDGKEVLLPTVIGGKIVSEDEAIQHYFDTGEYLGKFNTPQEADDYAQKLHERQEQYYGNQTGNVTPVATAPAGKTAPMYEGPRPEELMKQQNAAEFNNAMQDFTNQYRGNVEGTKQKGKKWSPVNISAQDELRKREANALGIPKEMLPYARENYGLQKAAETYKDRMNAASKSLDYDEYIKTMAEGIKYGAWDERDEVSLKSNERLKEEISSYDNRIAYQDTIDYSDEALERREKDIEKLEMIGTGWGTLYDGSLEDGTMLQRLGYHQYGKPADYHDRKQYIYNGDQLDSDLYYDYIVYDMTHVRTVAELNEEHKELTMKAAADPDNKVVQARLKEVEKELGRVRTEASEIWAGLYIGDQAFWDKRVREEKEAQRQDS